jgi:uncharacterized radical SAM superfamily Fe-S cluster-containing enzyme
VFLDVTNRCNSNCPICINNTPSMGFLFEPPLEYFENVFQQLSRYDPKPVVQLFGGEPTVRRDLFEIIRLARSAGLRPRVVTNGLKNKVQVAAVWLRFLVTICVQGALGAPPVPASTFVSVIPVSGELRVRFVSDVS